MATINQRISEIRARHEAEAMAEIAAVYDEVSAPGDAELRELLDAYREARKRKRPEMLKLMEANLNRAVALEYQTLQDALHDAYDSGRSVADLKEALGIGNNHKVWAEIWGDKKTRRGPRATTRGWEIVDDEPEMF